MSLILLLFFFFFANLFYIIMLWNNAHLDVVYPIFINSNEKINYHYEIESVFLKSAKKYISKYFKKPQLPNLHCDYKDHFFYNNDLLRESIKITPSGKYNIFFNHKDKAEIYLISHDNSITNTKGNLKERSGEIILYKTNLVGLTTKKSVTPDILTYKCWSNKIPGKILKVVFSPNKKVMGVYYRIVIGSSIVYRIRHFHDLDCLDLNKNKMYQLDQQIEQSIDSLINK